MISRNLSIRFGSFVAGLLISGIASLPIARAQDAAPSPSDPNAAPTGAIAATPSPGAPPQYAPAQPAGAAYKPTVLIPFVGVNSIQNDNSGTGPGFRVGGLFGGRMNDQISFNGEVLFDLVNFSNLPTGVSESLYFIQVALAPLYHLQASPIAEIVVGPKLGFFYDHASLSLAGTNYAYSGDASGSSEGILVGANLGAFFQISDALSLGGLVNFDYLREDWCNNTGCTTGDDGIKVISFSGAARF